MPEWIRFWKGLINGVILDTLIIILFFIIAIIIFSLQAKAYSIHYNYFKVVDQDTKLPVENVLATNIITQESYLTNETGIVFITVPDHLIYTYKLEKTGYQTSYFDQLSIFWRHPLDNETYEWEIPHSYLSKSETVITTPTSDLIVKFLIGISISLSLITIIFITYFIMQKHIIR